MGVWSQFDPILLHLAADDGSEALSSYRSHNLCPCFVSGQGGGCAVQCGLCWCGGGGDGGGDGGDGGYVGLSLVHSSGDAPPQLPLPPSLPLFHPLSAPHPGDGPVGSPEIPSS